MLGTVEIRHDIVLTNPPFGGTEGRHIQNNFAIKNNATELLFLQHILKKLKKTPNARAAIVVPEGTLFRGGAFAEVKKELLSVSFVQIERQSLKSKKKSNFLGRVKRAEKPTPFGFEKTYQQKR